MYALGFCLDESYLHPGMVAVASAADAIGPRARREVAVRVLTMNLRRASAASLGRLVSRLGFGSFRLHWTRPSRRAVMADAAYISLTTYLRFAFTKAFVGRPYLVYLDADVLVRGEVAAPLNALKADAVGGVVDEFNQAVGACPALPGLAADRPDLAGRAYLNAGVIWLHSGMLDRLHGGVESALATQARYILHNDQDALNLWFLGSGTAQPMPGAFNRFEIERYLEFGDWARRVVPRAPVATDAVVVHFVGANKPWHARCPGTEQVREYRSMWRRVMRFAGEPSARLTAGGAR